MRVGGFFLLGFFVLTIILSNDYMLRIRYKLAPANERDMQFLTF